ncbi:MAG: glycosyltransferase family 2 protein [Clostridia bacterium]|nr:glycosyltransferase family 2 protein [Clostridia bacterium]
MVDVSVIIPVYNASKHLEECIRSVCTQTLESIEIICVDDSSTDDSLEILYRLAQYDSRIVVLTQKNAGAGAARNHGLRLAQGKYLSFLDADDFFDPQMLEKAFRKAEAEQAELVVFKADFYNEKLHTFSPCVYGVRESMLPAHRPFSGVEIEKDIFKVVVGWAWDKLFLTDFVRENGLRFQEQRTSNDLLFVFSALAKAQRITTLPDTLAHQRRHAGGTLSVTREKSWMCFYDALIALREQLKAWGLYERFEQDYINYALHFSLWNLNTLGDPTKRKLYNQLRDAWFEELGIAGYPKEKFYHRGEYVQYVQVVKRPYNKRMQGIISWAQRGVMWVKRRMKP